MDYDAKTETLTLKIEEAFLPVPEDEDEEGQFVDRLTKTVEDMMTAKRGEIAELRLIDRK